MIGVLDWGVGGLGFIKVLRARHPDVRVVYWSDAGETPYGKLAAPALAARVREIAARLARRGVDRLVVACNAASTVLPRLGAPGISGVISTAAGPVQITGVIAHATRLALRARPRSIGVIGGQRTIRSGVYRRALAGGVPEIRQRVAQPLSARIEAGDLASAALERELRAILRPLRGIDTLLLACTHYPAIAPRIAAHLPGTHLFDPADELARWVGARWLDGARTGRDVFLTTGSPAAMAKAARAAFGLGLSATRVPR
jgi:glutamate racemase